MIAVIIRTDVMNKNSMTKVRISTFKSLVELYT